MDTSTTDRSGTDRSGPLPPPALRRLVESMPKAELHLHLAGSVRIDTALDLARAGHRVVQAGTQYRSHGSYHAAARELAAGAKYPSAAVALGGVYAWKDGRENTSSM